MEQNTRHPRTRVVAPVSRGRGSLSLATNRKNEIWLLNSASPFPFQSRRHVLNLTLCVTVVSVCQTDGSVMGIRTVRMGLTRVLNCAVSVPCPSVWASQQVVAICLLACLPPGSPPKKKRFHLSWKCTFISVSMALATSGS